MCKVYIDECLVDSIIMFLEIIKDEIEDDYGIDMLILQLRNEIDMSKNCKITRKAVVDNG